MEITHANFQKLCLLLRNDYAINGRGQNGVALINTNRDQQDAKNDLKKICGKCGCHTEGNCKPEVEEDTSTAEIYAKIE